MPPPHAVAAVTSEDPFAYYRDLRRERPFFFDESLDLWVASSHAAVAEALAHPHLRVRPPAEPVPAALVGTPTGDVFAKLVRMNDGPFHAENKPRMEASARRWTLPDVAGAAREAAKDLRPRLAANDFLAAVPVHTMARLLGVAAGELDATAGNVSRFVRGITPGATSQQVEQSNGAAQALMAQGAALGLDPVAAASRIAFMQQSLDATWALMAHAVLRLEEGGEPTRRFVTEVERHAAPTQNTRRFAAAPLEIAGHKVAQGQGILVILASANRDEALNPEPDRFDPDRAHPRSMGFGEGRHACPGAAIAIEIATAALTHLRETYRFNGYFGRANGYRPMGNIRCPVFAT